MSCSLANHPMLFPADTLGDPDLYFNVCTATNITSNPAAQGALATCCGSASVTTFFDGCYSYCNVTGSAAQQSVEQCFNSNSGSAGVDFACTDDENPLTASIVTLSASAGSTYLGGSSGTLVFPITTDSSAAASTTFPATTTTTGGTSAPTANTTNSASGSLKSSTTAKSSASASATTSGAHASTTANAGQPTVKQFSKGAVAILALAFVGLWA